MSCQHWIKQGYLYLANELNDSERDVFESHLAECEVCQNSLKENQILWDDLQTLKQVKPSRKLRRKILNYVHEANKKPQESWIRKIESFLLPKRPVYALSYAVIILIVGLVGFRSYRHYLIQNELQENLAWDDDFFVEASLIDEGFESVELGRFLDIPQINDSEQNGSWLSPMTDDLVELRQNMKDIMTTLYGI